MVKHPCRNKHKALRVTAQIAKISRDRVIELLNLKENLKEKTSDRHRKTQTTKTTSVDYRKLSYYRNIDSNNHGASKSLGGFLLHGRFTPPSPLRALGGCLLRRRRFTPSKSTISREAKKARDDKPKRRKTPKISTIDGGETLRSDQQQNA